MKTVLFIIFSALCLAQNPTWSEKVENPGNIHVLWSTIHDDASGKDEILVLASIQDVTVTGCSIAAVQVGIEFQYTAAATLRPELRLSQQVLKGPCGGPTKMLLFKIPEGWTMIGTPRIFPLYLPAGTPPDVPVVSGPRLH